MDIQISNPGSISATRWFECLVAAINIDKAAAVGSFSCSNYFSPSVRAH